MHLFPLILPPWVAGCSCREPAARHPQTETGQGDTAGTGCEFHSVVSGAPDGAVDGVDQDGDGADGPVIELRAAARWVVTGPRPRDRFGAAVACSAAPSGPLTNAVAIGADQRDDEDIATGYVVVFDGSATGELPLEAASWRVDGVFPEQLGNDLAFVGDVDGSGGDELVATAANAYRPDAQTGAAYLFDLGNPPPRTSDDAEAIFLGGAAGAMLGAVQPVGDVDDDGQADVLLAATTWGTADLPGQFRLYGGARAEGEVDTDEVLLRVDGVDPLTATGLSTAFADLTGDAVPDLVVGEFDWEGRGRVLVAPGPLAGMSQDALAVTPVVLSSSREPPDDVGVFLGHGDLDGDGAGDLAVSAHLESGPLGERQGAVALFFGPLTGPRGLADADLTIRGEVAFQWFGAGLLVADHDGDGQDDLIVAAPTDVYFGPFRPGLIYVFRGPIGRDPLLPSDADRVYRGAEPLEQLGWTMDGCDLDADGDTDLVLGAPGVADCMPGAGRVWVVDGGS